MKECRYCRKLIDEKDMLCSFCGYDYNTDTISQSFNPQEAQSGESKKKARKKEQKPGNQDTGVIVSAGVKKFAFIGIAVIIFSVLYKYNFNIAGFISGTGEVIARVRTGKIWEKDKGNKKDKSEEKVELIDVNSFDGTKKAIGRKDPLVEGIFFDPNGKSFATINGKVLSEGDVFGHIIVKKINNDWVELIVDGESKIIKVK